MVGFSGHWQHFPCIIPRSIFNVNTFQVFLSLSVLGGKEVQLVWAWMWKVASKLSIDIENLVDCCFLLLVVTYIWLNISLKLSLKAPVVLKWLKTHWSQVWIIARMSVSEYFYFGLCDDFSHISGDAIAVENWADFCIHSFEVA